MDLTDYRSQFDLHFLVPFSDDYQEVKVHLREKGHSLFHSTSVSRFFEEFRLSPSHLVIVELALVVGPLEDFLAETLEIASQTHFILVGPSCSRHRYWAYRDYGLLDYISSEDQLVGLVEWSIENSLERVVLKILNQNIVSENEEAKKQIALLRAQIQTEDTLSPQPVIRAQIQEDFLEAAPEVAEAFTSDRDPRTQEPLALAENIESQTNRDREEDLANLLTLYENTRHREDLLQVFFHSLEDYCDEGTKILYFKYLEPVQLLVATHGCGIPVEQIKGAGLRLKPEEILDSRILLLSPRGFGGLHKLLSDIFHVSECYVKPLMVREDIDGLFVFFGADLEKFNSIRFNNRFALFRVSFERFSFLKRQLELELEGLLEQIYPYEEFYDILTERLDQNQRHQVGLAVIRMSVDRLHYLEEKFGPTAVNSILRSLAMTGKKFSRSGDGFYRTALNEFTLLANHLKPQDATVLAERIRQAVEALEIPPVTGSITISIGVSAYPQLATSAEALMKGSLQALTTVMGQGGNRVGIARTIRQPKVVKFASHLEEDEDDISL